MKTKEIDFCGCDIIFEITRFCNMSCPHCIRGDIQRKRIKKEYINATLEALKSLSENPYIGTLTVSGGEPALAVDLINYIREACNHYNVEFGDFWMATNGTVTRPAFFEALEKMYTDCTSKEISGLRVSIDNYHDDINNIYAFREFIENLEYQGIKVYLEESGAPNNSEFLIGDGRAVENYYTTREVKHDLYLQDDGRLEGSIYINANGYIISTCDISYNKMDTDKDFIIGHVTDNWQKIFKQWFKKHPEQICKN